MELCPVVFFDGHLLKCLLKVNGVNKEEYIGSGHIIFEIPLKRARLCFLSGDTFLPAAAAPSSQTLNVVPARDFWVLRGNPDVPLSLLLFQNCVCGWGLRSSILLCFYEHLQVGRDIRVHWSFLAGLIEEISKCKTQIDCCWRRYSTAASVSVPTCSTALWSLTRLPRLAAVWLRRWLSSSSAVLFPGCPGEC